MNKYIITFICGDTVNIPTYDVVECDEKDLVPMLDKYSDYSSWRGRDWVKIYEVKELDKESLRERYDPTELEIEIDRMWIQAKEEQS